MARYEKKNHNMKRHHLPDSHYFGWIALGDEIANDGADNRLQNIRWQQLVGSLGSKLQHFRHICQNKANKDEALNPLASSYIWTTTRLEK